MDVGLTIIFQDLTDKILPVRSLADISYQGMYGYTSTIANKTGQLLTHGGLHLQGFQNCCGDSSY